MNIKKVDDKPMVIHMKEKTKLHVKGAPEAKIKGRNILAIDKRPKTAGSTKTGEGLEKKSSRTVSVFKVKKSGKGIKSKATQEKRAFYEDVRKSVRKEDSAYAKRRKADFYQKLRKDGENAAGKMNDTLNSIASVGTKMALDQMEGGDEVYESYMAAKNLSRPFESAADAGRQLYCRQAEKTKAERIKKVQAGKKIGKKTVKDSIAKTAKKAAKETAKTTVKVAASAAGAAAGTAGAGPGGVLIGVAAGEAVGRELDRRDMKNFTRNRMIQLFVSKLRQEESQDSIGKVLKDIGMMRFSMLVKHMVRYMGLFLLGLFLIVALLALPVIVMIAVIYNSPLAIFFPSISSGETTQQVLSAYAVKFNEDLDLELAQIAGYDRSEKVYVNFTGQGIPDNYCDILAVYMVKHGNGDTATDMTDKAKQNLRKVFDDMCSYSVTSGTETETDEKGNTISYTVKYVNVMLKTYQDIIEVYGFNTEEQDMLVELMKPEYLAMFGYDGSGEGEEMISSEQYQAIVDAISDNNGKEVVEFALSKVGYPYSQELRDSGTHFDCSSLAYYAWRHAGVNIAYQGSNTAAYEGKLCYDNNWLVHYDEMQPGDLIFYSYENNGYFMDISHVAVYVGDGKVVEAANTRIGVVYHPIQGKNSIVMIGRPR